MKDEDNTGPFFLKNLCSSTLTRCLIFSGAAKIPEVHRLHLAGPRCQNQRRRRGKILSVTS